MSGRPGGLGRTASEGALSWTEGVGGGNTESTGVRVLTDIIGAAKACVKTLECSASETTTAGLKQTLFWQLIGAGGVGGEW